MLNIMSLIIGMIDKQQYKKGSVIMKRTNSCTTKKSFAEISIFLASKWFFISIFVVTILCYMTPVYYGDGVSEMSTLELLRLKANPSFAIEPMQYEIWVILPRAV